MVRKIFAPFGKKWIIAQESTWKTKAWASMGFKFESMAKSTRDGFAVWPGRIKGRKMFRCRILGQEYYFRVSSIKIIGKHRYGLVNYIIECIILPAFNNFSLVLILDLLLYVLYNIYMKIENFSNEIKFIAHP